MLTAKPLRGVFLAYALGQAAGAVADHSPAPNFTSREERFAYFTGWWSGFNDTLRRIC
jgi:hypothetical protein